MLKFRSDVLTISRIIQTYTYPKMAFVAQWLARSAVNRKVGGSSPPRGDFFFGQFFVYFVRFSIKHFLFDNLKELNGFF